MASSVSPARCVRAGGASVRSHTWPSSSTICIVACGPARLTWRCTLPESSNCSSPCPAQPWCADAWIAASDKAAPPALNSAKRRPFMTDSSLVVPLRDHDSTGRRSGRPARALPYNSPAYVSDTDPGLEVELEEADGVVAADLAALL